jgi:hypothetical protein
MAEHLVSPHEPLPHDYLNITSSLQSIMSRTGSFPLTVAYRLLKHCAAGTTPIVFDAFCGKGTTLLAARLLGYPAYGMDVAPEAIVCTAAKLSNVTFDSVQHYIDGLPWNQSSDDHVPDSVRIFFHEEVLRQLMSVRSRLLRDHFDASANVRDNATFALASLLGILHGHSSFSLSISSAHAYAMAPRYVSRYAQKHGLEPPLRDVKACLLEKVRRCLRESTHPSVPSDVRLGSAIDCQTVFPELIGRVDLILTSPPYLNAQTYAKDNWLRLWFLGHDHKELKKNYIETGSPRKYHELMTRVFEQLASMLKVGGHLICISGDVRLPTKRRDGNIFQTGAALATIAQSQDIGLRLESCDQHNVPSHQRYLHAISKSDGHSKRPLVERVFVARKVRTPQMPASHAHL